MRKITFAVIMVLVSLICFSSLAPARHGITTPNQHLENLKKAKARTKEQIDEYKRKDNPEIVKKLELSQKRIDEEIAKVEKAVSRQRINNLLRIILVLTPFGLLILAFLKKKILLASIFYLIGFGVFLWVFPAPRFPVFRIVLALSAIVVILKLLSTPVLYAIRFLRRGSKPKVKPKSKLPTGLEEE